MGIRKLKKIILRLTPEVILNFYQNPIKSQINKLDDHATLSYSQEGEDLILKRIFEGHRNGFYIDVGAHHPKRFSNTYLFYKMGWRGINIDAMPGSMDLFHKIRPDDINIECPISDKEETIIFHIFNEPALNTFNLFHAKKFSLNINYKVIEKKELRTYPLVEVLERFNPEGKQIDFMSVDVEGLDLKVLKSNNWSKFRPLIILVELLEMESINEIKKNEIFLFLTSKGYVFFAKTINTCFFKISN